MSSIRRSVRWRITITAAVIAAAMLAVCQLARLVRNLLSNAVRAARSEVVVELREADGVVVLRVDDNGPGIPVADRAAPSTGRVGRRTLASVTTHRPTHDEVVATTAETARDMPPQQVPVNVYETPGALVIVAPFAASVQDSTYRHQQNRRCNECPTSPRILLPHPATGQGYSAVTSTMLRTRVPRPTCCTTRLPAARSLLQ